MTPEDTSHPVTQQQLREALDGAVQTITAAIQGLQTEIRAAEDRAQKFARGIESNLPTAFQGHAKGQTARLHTAELTTYDMGIRIAALEERVLNIETRQRPPQ